MLHFSSTCWCGRLDSSVRNTQNACPKKCHLLSVSSNLIINCMCTSFLVLLHQQIELKLSNFEKNCLLFILHSCARGKFELLCLQSKNKTILLHLKNFVLKYFKIKFSKVNKRQWMFRRKLHKKKVSKKKKKKKKSLLFAVWTLHQMDDLKFKAQKSFARFRGFFSSCHPWNYSWLKKIQNSKLGEKLNFAQPLSLKTSLDHEATSK